MARNISPRTTWSTVAATSAAPGQTSRRKTLTDRTIILGLDATDMTLLWLTLVVSMPTFALERTDVLLGAVHLLLFLACLMLIFEG